MDQREMPPISYYRHSRPFPGVELIIEIFDLQLFITTSVVSNVLSQWACSWWVVLQNDRSWMDCGTDKRKCMKFVCSDMDGLYLGESLNHVTVPVAIYHRPQCTHREYLFADRINYKHTRVSCLDDVSQQQQQSWQWRACSAPEAQSSCALWYEFAHVINNMWASARILQWHQGKEWYCTAEWFKILLERITLNW